MVKNPLRIIYRTGIQQVQFIMKREFCMKKGKLIGSGKTAEVYEWGNDKVLKLYFKSISDDWIKNETEIVTKIHGAGIPTPEVFEIVEVNGRKGVIFERVIGEPVIIHVAIEPWKLLYYAKQMAQMQFEMHKFSLDTLPPQKEKLSKTIETSAKILGSKKIGLILDYLEALPGGASLCHGDIHFGNVMVTKKGLIALDWTNAYQGNPLGDVARTCLVINSSAPFGDYINLIKPYAYTKCLLHQSYLNEYIRLAKVSTDDVDNWELPIAAARLRAKIPGEERWLLQIINKHLKQL